MSCLFFCSRLLYACLIHAFNISLGDVRKLVEQRAMHKRKRDARNAATNSAKSYDLQSRNGDGRRAVLGVSGGGLMQHKVFASSNKQNFFFVIL